MRKNKTFFGVLIAAGIFLLVYSAVFAVSASVYHIIFQNEVCVTVNGEELKRKDYFREAELHGYTGEKYSYITGIGVTEEGINGNASHDIPPEINGKPVCFTNDALKNLIWERSRVAIPIEYEECDYYILENGMLISPDKTAVVFYFGSGGDIIIPQGVERIGEYAFYDCEIQSLALPDSVTEIRECAFAVNCISELALSSSLESIGKDAFTNLDIEELVLPESVKTIGQGAFRNGSMKYISLPKGLETLESFAFGGCGSLEKFDINCPCSVLSNTMLFYGADENRGRLVINSAEPFYPLDYCSSLVAFEEVLLVEPCSEADFEYTKVYEKVEHNLNYDASVEYRNGEQVVIIISTKTGSITTVHFAFAD